MSASLVDRVRSRLVTAQSEATPAHVASVLRAEGIVLGDAAVLDLVESLHTVLVGAGPLQVLLDDPMVTDVVVNGPDDIWVDRGGGLQRTSLAFASDAEVRRLAQRLASGVGRRLDEANPYVDARLDDGTRLHAVIPPISMGGTLLSFRVPRKRALTLDDMVACESIDQVGARWLRAIIEARVAFVISGGTGSGKTTVLRAMIAEMPAHERLVIVEDSTELMPDHPHAVSLQARTANIEGAGVVTMRDLVRQSLRMRPDRIVVGEVRGAEVVDLLSALNTGHEGGCGTVHANSAADVPARFEALGLAADLDRDATHALLGTGIDAVIHMARDGDGHRAIEAVHVLTVEQDRVRTLPALRRIGGCSVAEPGLRMLADRIARRGVDAPPLA